MDCPLFLCINIVNFQKSKIIFEMIIQLKTWQVKEISALLESYDLAM